MDNQRSATNIGKGRYQMTKDREALIRRVIVRLVAEQSCGEWDDKTIDDDADHIFEGLFLFFDSGEIK
tara:strand:+ start:679 stop:882 length:204 start_codon:yes stop_codon:yes gene_type:complete